MKYQNILNDYDKVHWDILNKIFDESIEYIKSTQPSRELEIKIAGVYVVTKIYFNTDQFSIIKIKEYIDNFYKYLDDNFENYRNSFVIMTDEFDLKTSFYKKYLKETFDVSKF